MTSSASDPDPTPRPVRAGGDQVPPVVIVGAGPVGLALGMGLAREGVHSVLVEKASETSGTSKAPGVHVRTREIFRLWGIEKRFLDAGSLLQPLTVYSVTSDRPLIVLDFSQIADEAERPGLLILEQSETERQLLESVRETGMCDVRFECEAIALRQDDEKVTLTVRERGEEREIGAKYLVGCDGASSFVRQALELPFDGHTYSLRPMLADVRVEDGRDALPQPRAWTGGGGFAFTARLRPGLWRIVHLARRAPAREEVTEEEVRDHVDRLLGPGPAAVTWASRFRIHVRASPSFRVRRILLAGDAAHVHSPASGFGMNGGIQDAHNLAWKLAAVLDGGDEERLLNSYEIERREVVVETTARHTDRLTRIFIQSPLMVRAAAWILLRILLRLPSLRRRNLRRIAMLDLDYPASPLLDARDAAAGVRLPNPELVSPDGGTTRLYDLLGAGPAILDVADDRAFADDLPLDRTIRIGPGAFSEPAGLLRGLLNGHDGWILVRPDAYVGWARRRREGLEDAVRAALGR